MYSRNSSAIDDIAYLEDTRTDHLATLEAEALGESLNVICTGTKSDV